VREDSKNKAIARKELSIFYRFYARFGFT